MRQEVCVFCWTKSGVKFIGHRHFNSQILVCFVYLTTHSVAPFRITKQRLYPLAVLLGPLSARLESNSDISINSAVCNEVLLFQVRERECYYKRDLAVLGPTLFGCPVSS
jgi:hypothetical protein